MTTTNITSDILRLSIDESASFIAAVKAVATSASTDKGRPILCDILIEIEPTKITLSATNSYMLSIVTMEGPGWLNNINAKFHVNAKELVKAMPTGRSNTIDIEVVDKSLVIEANGTLRYIPKGDGEFPNIKGLTAGYEVKTDGVGVDFGINPKLMSVLIKQADVFRGKANEGVPVRIKAAETDMKPIHMKCTVIDRGEWYGLIMPVRG